MKECAEKHFKQFVECAPQYIKSAIEKSEKLKHNLFQVFLAGFHKGFLEFESMEELERMEKESKETKNL